jgi:hypothetical protein
LIQWSNIRFLGNSNLVKQNYIWIFLVPILFKLFFSSEHVQQLFNSNFLIELPFSWTLLYFAALSFALGNLVYLIFCPKIIQSFSDYSEYKNSGYRLVHLNKYINYLFGKDSNRILLLNKLTTLSDETPTQCIDGGSTSVIEIKENGKAYNIKNSFENDLFWFTYDHSDEIKNIPLFISCISFSFGFILLFSIFIQNLMFVISKI